MTYIIKSTALSEDFIHSQIESCVNQIELLNSKTFGYWIFQLYDDDGNKISKRWNEENLREMMEDVNCLVKLTENNSKQNQ